MKRAYSMSVRGERAEATRQRILEVARELFMDQATDFTLEQIATTAGVSVQTVLRAFGNKQTLIVEAIGTFRPAELPVIGETPMSTDEAVKRLFDDYEEIGDRVIRMLAEEHRIPAFADVADVGRRMHRAWVEAAFAEPLAVRAARERERILIALLAATDVYVWKLLRRDLNLGRKASESTVEQLIRGVLIDNKEA